MYIYIYIYLCNVCIYIYLLLSIDNIMYIHVTLYYAHNIFIHNYI